MDDPVQGGQVEGVAVRASEGEHGRHGDFAHPFRLIEHLIIKGFLAAVTGPSPTRLLPLFRAGIM